jgi:hypothetical protein
MCAVVNTGLLKAFFRNCDFFKSGKGESENHPPPPYNFAVRFLKHSSVY